MRRLSLGLFLVFVFTVPWQNAIAIGGSKTLTSFVGMAALAVALLSCLIEGKVRKPPIFFFAFGALVVWQLASYFWSLDPMLTLTRVITMVQLLAMIWAAGELCAGEKERLALIQAFVLGCLVLCVALIQAYLSGQSLAGFRYAPAGFNPNESADIIAVGIPMALLVATSHWRSALRWLNVVYVPLGVFAVILTASRSGFIAACLALTSVFFAIRQARPLYRVVWVAIILGAFVGLFYGLPVDHGLETNIDRITFSNDTRSLGTLTGRTTIWSDGLEMFTESPIAGMGANTFITNLEARGGGWHAAHNIWVETAVETGIIGLLLLALAVTTAVIPALQHRDFRTGFHAVLFLVLMTTSLVANLMISKAFWIGMAILALTVVLGESRSASEVAYPEVCEHVSVIGGS